MIFDAERYDHLPALIGLARQPFMRPDGSIVTNSGFDPLSGYFGVFDARDFSIPTRPTKDQALSALGELKALLSEFSFQTANDQAAALAAILTAAARPSLELAPMFHVRAPLAGSGKSYLTSVISAFCSPSPVPSNAMPGQDDELRKMLMAELMTSPAAIIFDNLTTDLLPYPKLCSALTEEFLADRILGVSKQVTVSTRVLFLSSGNNVGPVKDMPRRVVTIHIDPQVENPIAREFTHSPLIEVRQRRGYYVSLALTIIRAWMTNGKPYTKCPAYGSYGQWCDWIRQPLMWLGEHDPVLRVFEAINNDPDRETLGRVLVAWKACFGSTPTKVREAIQEAGTKPELHEVFLEIAEHRGAIHARNLGFWLGRHALRIVDGLRFEKDWTQNNSQRWKVKTDQKTGKKDANQGFSPSGESGQSGVLSEWPMFGSTEKNDFEVEL